MVYKPSYEVLESQVESLFEINRQFDSFFNNISDIFIIIDPQLTTLWANRQATDAFPEILGNTCHKRLFNQPHACPDCPVIKSLKTCSTENALMTTVRHNGGKSFRMVTAVPLDQEKGDVKRIAVLSRDITPYFQTEKDQQACEKSAEKYIEPSPVAIRIAQEGKLVYANPAYLTLLGYEHFDEVKGKAIVDFYPPEYQPLIRKWQEKRLAGKFAPVHYQAKALKKDGKLIEIEKWVTAIDHQGKPAILSFIVDITESKALKERLRISERQQALGTLAGGIAHDFNNIISAIIGYAEWVQINTSPGQSEIAYGIDNIIKACQRAGNLVKQIKEFSQQIDQISAPIKISQIVAETVQLMLPSIPDNINVHIESKIKNDYILGDSTRIHQVVMNLCKNAFQAMEEAGGDLEIILDHQMIQPNQLENYPNLKPGPYLKLSVRDTGHGMSEDVLERIFDPYFTTKRQEIGTGIGLAVVYRIVKNHNGAIVVNSRPGKGTVFHVFFPLIAESRKEEPRPSEIALGGNETILFVDDDNVIVDIAQRILNRLGYRVVARTNPMDALEAFRARPDRFDMVITDMVMPAMSGEKLATEILSMRPDIPVIFCTGYTDEEIMGADETSDAITYLMKPFTMQDFAKAIRRVLDKGKESSS